MNRNRSSIDGNDFWMRPKNKSVDKYDR